MIEAQIPPSHFCDGKKIDDVLAEIIQKCLFCGKDFETRSRTFEVSGKEYCGDSEEVGISLAQIGVNMLRFGFTENTLEAELNKIFSRRKENLERKLSKSNLEDYLVKAARERGLNNEDYLYREAKSNLLEIRPKYLGYLGQIQAGVPAYYNPKELACHKACLPSKDIFTVGELMKTTQLKNYFAIKIQKTPVEYKSLIPLFRKSQIKFEYQECDPFHAKWIEGVKNG